MFKEVKQFNDKLVKGGSGSCVKSALYHVSKAEALVELDPEMSAFRLITAEEEAATAILLMLKEHGYEGAKELNKNNHVHKQSLYPFICSIHALIASQLARMPGAKVTMEWAKVERLDAIKLCTHLVLDNIPVEMEMEPPLNFKVEQDDELHDFSQELSKFLESKGFSDTVKHLKNCTNLRNKLLYSDGKCIPNTLSDLTNGKFERFARFQLQKINVLIAIYFMSAPYKKDGKAIFLEQALDNYLKVLNHVKGKRL